MTVVLVGSGPVLETVRPALGDLDIPVQETGLGAIERADLAIVTGLAGSDGFDTANEIAIASQTPWIAVELGGIGGSVVEELDAAVTTFDPGRVCFECLKTRVETGDTSTDTEPTAAPNAARLAGSYAGLLATEILTGNHLAGSVIEIPYARRTLLPVPGCESAPDSVRSFDVTHVCRSQEESIGLAEQAVDGRLGIVEAIGEHDSFPAPYYLAHLAETGSFSDGSVPKRAAGVAVDWDTAFMKALGESLERYSAAIYREESFHRAPVSDIGGPSPADFVRPDDNPVLSPDMELAWVPGRHLETEENTYLPAGLVHFPSPDSRFVPAITSGLGLGNGTVEAIISGLTEIIERDATMIGWYSTFEPLGLEVASEEFGQLSRRAASEGLSVEAVLVTQDIDVPVVSVAVHRDEWPRFAVGSAAGLDAPNAAVSALAEALQNWMELRGMGESEANGTEGEIGRYADDPSPALTFFRSDTTVRADRVGPDDPPDGRGALELLVERVAAAGLDSYAARITPRDVEQLGFEAVRVLSPQAQPLFVNEPFFGERARTVPLDLGFKPYLDREFHPYP